MTKHLVFVYGSLRRGNAGAMSARFPKSKFIGLGNVSGRLYDLGEYPGLLLDASNAMVVGEVYEVDDATLNDLDEFEATDHYRRKQVEVSIGSERKTCWIYVPEYAGEFYSDRPVVSSGDWMEYSRAKTNAPADSSADLDHQIEYWDRIGPGKPFGHPVNFERVEQWLKPDSRILDFGCGYGRVLGLLSDRGYHNLMGVDPAPAMVAMARERFPTIAFEGQNSPPHLPIADASVDAVLLFSVLTCVPTDAGQRAIVDEACRVLRPGGLLYVSDLWLQTDERNKERYLRDEAKYGTYGTFDLPEGVTVRHHDPRWIRELTSDFDAVALDDIDVRTMNGNPAKAFQWFGLNRRKPTCY